MAFATFNPTDLDSAIQSICTQLASAHGWTTNYNAGTGTVDITGKTATFTLTNTFVDNSATWGYQHGILHVDVTGVTTPWQTSCNALWPLTKMWVFSGTTPEPWVHLVFETYAGFYHHVYFGYVERLGGFTGGAIADSTGWHFSSSATLYNWTSTQTSLLFGGFSNNSTSSGQRVGALEIEDAGAAGSTYRFCVESSGVAHRAGGGWGDGYNGTLCWANPNSVEDHVIFHPVMLFADLQNDKWVTPVACVPGVRMININHFTNASLVAAGGKNWRVFPLCHKDTRVNISESPGYVGGGSAGNYGISGDTSSLGIAILEE